MSDIPNQDITYRIIGAAMRVHNEFGPGLKETIYHRALASAMRDDGLSFEIEKPVPVELDEGEAVGLLYLDAYVEDSIVVEVKALSHLMTNDEIAQVITYLAVTEAKVGLLINFGRSKLDYERVLPPKSLDTWRARVARYAWQPTEAKAQRQPEPASAESSAVRLSVPYPLTTTSGSGTKGREATTRGAV